MANEITCGTCGHSINADEITTGESLVCNECNKEQESKQASASSDE
ncbi:MAG: hypothetical protein GF398_20990 [Chitinivibrionales bacterium]|nr:hypothetical protein [Chitinivibrionales bacterium]